MESINVRNPSELSQWKFIILQLFSEDIEQYKVAIEDFFMEYNDKSFKDGLEYKQVPIYAITAKIIINIMYNEKDAYLKEDAEINEKQIYSALSDLRKQGAIKLIDDKYNYIKENKVKLIENDKWLFNQEDKRDYSDSAVFRDTDFYIIGENYDVVFTMLVKELAERFGIAAADHHIYSVEDTTQILSDEQKNSINDFYLELCV